MPDATSALDTPRAVESRGFRVAGRLVQPHLNRIQTEAGTVQVEPKIMQVLVCLAQRPGEVVTKSELIERVWQGVFVTEDVLVRAIAELRKLLEDGEGAPRVIETIRKRGYRLVAPVVHDLSRVPASGERPSERPAPAGLRRPAWILAVLAVTALGLFVARRASVPAPPRFIPLTTLPGNEFDPVLSPDGTRVAFSWDRGVDGGPTSIYVKLVDAESTLRLTEGADDRAPVWSEDGTRVAFVRRRAGGCEIGVVAALGGPVQRLVPCRNPEHPRVHFAKDGRTLLATRSIAGSASQIVRIPLDGGPETALTHPPSGVVDVSAIPSPDGRRVAFIRELSDAVGDLFVVSATGGEPLRLTQDNADLMGFDWMGSGRLVFSSNRAGMFSLWTVSAAGGEPSLLSGGGRKIKHPSASALGDSVAYEVWEYEMNVWRVDVGAGGASTEAVAPATDEWTFEPRLSPDGRRLAFVSTRSGNYELWASDPDGGRLARLTSFHGPYVGQPRWSPDGRRLAFVARPAGRAQVFVIDADGGTPKALGNGSSDEVAPSFSADGRFLYLATLVDGTWQVRSRSLETGIDRTITRDGGYAALESTDARWLYFSRVDRAGLWRQPGGGGTAEEVTAELRPEHWACWGVSDAGVYWLAREAGDVLAVRLLRADAAQPQTIERITDLAWPGLELSRDGRTLMYSRLGRHSSNLVLLAYPR
jgi:Tol biopolymer transport system component/DNA-binding winged helix-turn-helix (wHTH) protein